MKDFAKDDAAERARIKQIIAELLPKILSELLPGLLLKLAPGDSAEIFLTESQVEDRWEAARGYCAELRRQGTGPPFVRLSPRCLRYRLRRRRPCNLS